MINFHAKKIIFVIVLTLSLIFSAFFISALERQPEKPQSIKGDADRNGKITSADARLTLFFSSRLIKTTDIDSFAADFDSDGKITASDARKILHAAAGIELTTEQETLTEEASSEETKFIFKVLPVPALCQYPDLPTGCESVVAVMTLNYCGVEISPTDFVEKYIKTASSPKRKGNIWQSADPNEYFLGDPTSYDGWGIWAKGLAAAAERCINDKKADLSVKITYSETLESLCEKYISKNIPVQVWVTEGMQTPYESLSATIINTDKTYSWISPNHCMLLVGFDETGYYFNDPITGKKEKYAKDISQKAFEGNGSQAVIIERN